MVCGDSATAGDVEGKALIGGKLANSRRELSGLLPRKGTSSRCSTWNSAGQSPPSLVTAHIVANESIRGMAIPRKGNKKSKPKMLSSARSNDYAHPKLPRHLVQPAKACLKRLAIRESQKGNGVRFPEFGQPFPVEKNKPLYRAPFEGCLRGFSFRVILPPHPQKRSGNEQVRQKLAPVKPSNQYADRAPAPSALHLEAEAARTTKTPHLPPSSWKASHYL